MEELKTYRCPACGEMVDNYDREAVRVHHDHVLRPPSDLNVTLPVVHVVPSRLNKAKAKERNADLPALAG